MFPRRRIISGPPPPRGPSSFSVSQTTTTNFHLTWTDRSVNELGFKIYRSTDGITYTLRATVALNITSYDDTVSGGTTYYYRVSSYNAGGERFNSNGPQNLYAIADSDALAYANHVDVNVTTSTYNLVRSNLDVLYLGLKSDGIYTHISDMWLDFNQTSTCARGMKLTARTLKNSPIFDGGGLTYNGTNQYGETGIVPATDATMSTNSAFLYCLIGNGTTPFEGALMGTGDATPTVTLYLSVGDVAP